MRRSVIVMSIVAVGLSMGVRNANAARIVTADETTGQVPSDFSFLTDSIVGLLCNANEDLTACFAKPYTVDSSFISPAFPNGGFAGVDLFDVAGSDTPGNLSDQLYLNVTPILGTVGGLFNVQWCWDSDKEPNVNICQLPDPAGSAGSGWPGAPAGFTAVPVNEPNFGFTNLTSSFTGTAGPLAAGQWTIQAQSEAPEPASLFLIGGGFVVGAICFRKRRGFQPNDLPKRPSKMILG
jgi:hypothetical protein